MTAPAGHPAAHPRRAGSYADRAFTLDVLARTLWGEARGEGAAGMQAVACVILNRAARPGWWGRSVAEICLKPWQFSCWLPDDPNRAKLEAVTGDDPAFAEARRIAGAALGGTLADYSFGATHYHTVSTAPGWARGRTPCAVIGRHAFYNDIA
ncbi:cell wall hydrolase [Ferrovibrio sp.]|uniref:cell wall hydrolase n=1 Tax=Ferrovibrio sp. TaxID=1917215 RepID=UPI00311D7BFA